MRRTNKPEWILGDDDELIGVALGSDFCAEHEWGIKGIKDSLGIDYPPNRKRVGIEKRTVTHLSGDLSYDHIKGVDCIFLVHRAEYLKSPEAWLTSELASYSNEGSMTAAWDEKSFGIAVRTDEDKARLKELWEAFQRKDVAIWPNIGVFHTGTGLTFVIPSRVPQEHLNMMKNGDLSNLRLEEAVKAIGIEEDLKKAGKRYIALRPRWRNPENEGEGVIFWLNPYDQKNVNYGWFTIEDLRAWIRGEGPIPKQSK